MTTISTSRSKAHGVALVAAAAALAAVLAGCGSSSTNDAAGSTSSHSAGSSPPASAASTQHQQTSSATSDSGSGGGRGCAAIKSATLTALLTVPVGEPYDEGSGACEFGVGANAGLRGSAVQTTNGDSLLAQLIPGIGASEYTDDTTRQPVTPLAGIGDQASFVTGDPLKVFALKGKDFCLIQLNISDASAVGLPADSSGTIPDQDATAIATKVGALCTDMFGGSG